LNRCGAAKKWKPNAQTLETSVSEDTKAVYAFNAKAASSTFRSIMGVVPFGNRSADAQNLTWFSFVRDPLLRSVSGFFEIHLPTLFRDVCMEDAESQQNNTANVLPPFCNVGVNPHMANPGDGARVLARFEAMVTALENRTFEDIHFDPQHNHVYAVNRLSFIGRVEKLQADWNELGKLQADKFGVSWPALPNSTVRATVRNVYDLFSIKSVPDDLAKRICNLYKDDYCCHQLPFPSQCREFSC
jgi:hypothetical protein